MKVTIYEKYSWSQRARRSQVAVKHLGPPIALIHVREKKHIALIHVREKDILMDALTRMLEEEWSRGTAHLPWGLEERYKQTS